jgi:hypothetical protein
MTKGQGWAFGSTSYREYHVYDSALTNPVQDIRGTHKLHVLEVMTLSRPPLPLYKVFGFHQ